MLPHSISDPLLENSTKNESASIFQKLRRKYRNVPPKYKRFFFLFWIGWKICLTLFFYLLLRHQTTTPTKKLLYIIVSERPNLNLIDDCLPNEPLGHFETQVYLILGYSRKQEHALPTTAENHLVGTWYDARPYNYPDLSSSSSFLSPGNLFRQHRFVVMDHLLEYDQFVVVDDTPLPAVSNITLNDFQILSNGYTISKAHLVHHMSHYCRWLPGVVGRNETHDNE